MSIVLPPIRTTGLTLGKFAPLHRGHQLLIETALAEVDHLIVIIYDSPLVTPVPLPLRSAWLRALYPQLTVIEAWGGPQEVGDTPIIQQQHEAYIAALLGDQHITHFYSSEFYGAHMSRTLHAVDRRVDPARATVPISATRIRADSYAHRAYLHPRVYRDLVTNVVVLGAPSTGKTTLAARLAALYQTHWMPEYGREFWEQHQHARRLTPAQLVTIAETHLAREEQLLCEARQYLFTDTNALTTAIFALDYHGAVLPRLAQLADAAATRYDLVLLCDTDIPYDATWDRSGAVQRHTFQQRIIADLVLRNIPYITIRGTLDARVAQVQRVLAYYRPYHSLTDLLWAANEGNHNESV